MNLGGPVLPASFRRPPMSIGSPLNGKAPVDPPPAAAATGPKKPLSSQLDHVSMYPLGPSASERILLFFFF